MKAAEGFVAVYLYRDVVDFRKSIDGLTAIVAEHMKQDAFSGALFVFCSGRRDKLKAVYWDRSGFALWYKRLEEEKFVWPRRHPDGVVELSGEKLRLLLDGIDIWTMRPHRTLSYRHVALGIRLAARIFLAKTPAFVFNRH